ncbi:MAG: glycosyltransferase [Longimicrobiales bacterium]
MSSRPRVFFVLGSLEANDMGEEIVAILGRLSRAAFEPRVIALGGRDDLRERIAQMKVRVYPLGLSGPIGAVLAVWKVRNMLRNMDAEVVHGFGSWGGAVAELAAPKGVAVVRTVSRPPASGRDLRGWLLGFLERRAARHAGTHFVVPREDVRSVVQEHYGGGEVTVLPTSVDVAGIRERVRTLGREASRVQLGVAPDDMVFVCLTPFHSESAMDEILRGIAVARREREGLRIFLVGSGRYEGSSRWKAEELRLDDAVVFLGRGPEVEAVWAAADVVVDASPWSDWSRGALVAHAAGLPVVKRVEGVVDDGLAEGVMPPRISGRADWFGSDLVRLAERPELRERVRKAGEGVVDGNDVAWVAQELKALYESLGQGDAS